MLDFPLNATEETILEGVKQWVELFGAERYDEAVQWLYCPPAEVRWKPLTLKSLVTNYGLTDPRTDGKTYRVTAIATAKSRTGAQPYQDVEWFSAGSLQVGRGVVGFVTFDLPLNGEWSDVTATFLIHKVADRLRLQLEDMHVL